ncbi:hypothetical protein EIP86_005736 [Pleurotus ostreatoroseus]|nr:hypothetical protein EIP86_005736 [Pleurotus ostreatoroseus]
MGSSDGEDHVPLLGVPVVNEQPSSESQKIPSFRRKLRVLGWVVLVQSVVILALLVAPLRDTFQSAKIEAHLVYSPANDAILYETRHFDERVNKSASIFCGGPSDEVDDAWTSLYNYKGPSQISRAEADRLPKKTLPIPDDPDHYIVQLSVLHNLHCLNFLRKTIYMDHYADPATGNVGKIPGAMVPDHIGHCLNMLRQALMCSADLSVNTMMWSDSKNQAMWDPDSVHTCKNWEAIEDWAQQHILQTFFDPNVRVVGEF